jgi:hypothetical protein
LLLDNQLTVNLFCNAKLLKNIRPSNTRMNVRCNAGQRTVTMVGDLPGYGTVWYDSKSIANILSLKRVAEKYHVAFDSENGGSFIVTKPDGTVFEFQQSPGGLYFLDMDKKVSIMVNSVAANKGKNYTNEDYLKALCARQLHTIIGQPNTKHLIQIVASNHQIVLSLKQTSSRPNTSLDRMWVPSKARLCCNANHTWQNPTLSRCLPRS